MVSPFFSIIMPVYNAAAFLERSVGSILRQTFQNFELILVDDGSTDNSGVICDSLSQKDGKIKVLHIANGGPSRARNCGLDHAFGKWVVFIDSDDYVANDYLENFLKYNKEDEQTQVIQGFHVVDEFNKEVEILPKTLRICSYEFGRINIAEYNELVEKYRLLHRHEIWARTFSRKIIEQNRLRMDESLKSYEDGVFWLNYLCCISSVLLVPERGYYYYYPQKSLSIMHTHKKDVNEIIKTMEHTKVLQQKIIKLFVLKGKYREDFYRIFFNQYKHVYLNARMSYCQAERLKTLRPISQEYIRDFKDLFFWLVSKLPFYFYLKVTKHLYDDEKKNFTL